MHRNADKLLKMLVKATPCLGDGEQNPEIFSPDPESSTTSPANISTISLGLGKGNMLKAKKLVDFSAGELDELLLKKDCTNKAVHDQEKARTEYTTWWMMRLPLILSASNGIIETL